MKKRNGNLLHITGSGLKHSHAGGMLTDEQKSEVLQSSSAGEILPNKEEARVLDNHT